MNGSTE